ncbi:hypothetical protein SAMD00023353_0602580 [Rosellinia necatrix]|uniref:Uncharacterized protein n=1 Tax=Rosellinia necatrix TaxID=77044 RepID=A0A1S8A5R6_ROSNE|nr:hypothetical protein SAMD00023353_0602580 [Rosellinia necatrix]
MEQQASFLAHLQLRLAPDPGLRHGISVSVTNAHPSMPVTILKWNSPLDPAALALGLVRVTPAGAAAPVDVRPVKISRAMPPSADALVTLLPGESATNSLDLSHPVVPGHIWDAGAARVRVAGRWMAVWPGLTKGDVLSDAGRLRSVGAGVGSLVGECESEYIEVR